MKKIKIAFILSLFVFMPLMSNAQFDTMYINNAYRSQYMFPELKSPACQQVIEDFQFWCGATLNEICQSHGVGSYENCVKKVGHKFDVTDTVKLIGTGILITTPLLSLPGFVDYDSITVSIWDSNLTTELYSKRVFRACYHPDLPLSERRLEQAIIIGIEIRDEAGRLLEERRVNERNLQLNVSNYSAGTYVVVVITDKGRIGKKFIVQK